MKQLNKIFSFFAFILIIFTTFSTFGCSSSSSNNKPIEINDYIIINQETISENEGKYKIAAGEKIWYNEGDNKNIILGHDLINLPLLSEDNNDFTIFLIQGTIDFGFFVSPDMDCTIDTYSDSGDDKVNIYSSAKACGVVLGSLVQPTEHDALVYSHNLKIKKNVYFNIRGWNQTFGIYFAITLGISSSVTINGVYLVNCAGPDGSENTVYGLFFYKILTNSNQNINGVFKVTANMSAYGIQFNYIEHDTTQYISGVFSITSQTGSAYGIGLFEVEENVTQYIDWILTLCAISGRTSQTRVINYDVGYNNSCNLILKGSILAHAKDFSSFIRNSNSNIANQTNKNITANVVLLTEGNIVYSIWGTTNVNDTLTIPDSSNFFSNVADSGFIYWDYPNFTNKYKWNGVEVNKTTDRHNDSVGDTLLRKKRVLTTDRLFFIEAVQASSSSSDATQIYNQGVFGYLNTYIDSNICPNIAKTWFEEINTNIFV